MLNLFLMAQDKVNRKSIRHFDLQKGSTRNFELEKDSVESIPSQLEELKREILADGVINAEKVEKIRKELYADGAIDKEEAEFLFEINDKVCDKANDPNWKTFFVEAISDFLLNNEKSPNVIDKEEGEWLVKKIENDGKVDLTEKSLLLDIQEKAKSMPEGVKNLIRSIEIHGGKITSSTNVLQSEKSGSDSDNDGNGSGSKKWLWIILIFLAIIIIAFLLFKSCNYNGGESSSALPNDTTTNISNNSQDSTTQDSTKQSQKLDKNAINNGGAEDDKDGSSTNAKGVINKEKTSVKSKAVQKGITEAKESDAQVTKPERVQQPMSSNSSIEAKAKQVIRGDFGNGSVRKQKLGSEYTSIQNKVNEMYRTGAVR